MAASGGQGSASMSVASLPTSPPSFYATETETGDSVSELSTVTSSTRNHSKSPTREGRSRSLFGRMSANNGSSTTAAHEEGGQGQHHHGGFLEKVKSIYSGRPSSRDRHSSIDEDRASTAPSTHDGERGRHSHRDGDFMVSTGRGGAGNLRAASRTREAEEKEIKQEADARADSRERSRDRGHVGGRGGAGNFRSASKDPAMRAKDSEEQRLAQAEERRAVEKRIEDEGKHVHSHGRGGAGNIK